MYNITIRYAVRHLPFVDIYCLALFYRLLNYKWHCFVFYSLIALTFDLGSTQVRLRFVLSLTLVELGFRYIISRQYTACFPPIVLTILFQNIYIPKHFPSFFPIVEKYCFKISTISVLNCVANLCAIYNTGAVCLLSFHSYNNVIYLCIFIGC